MECVFIWGEVRRDWLCLLSDCCPSVSSTTNRDSLLFIWTPAHTFDLSKWVANPSQSYCGGPLVAIPATLPPCGLAGELQQVYTSKAWWQVLVGAPVQRKKSGKRPFFATAGYVEQRFQWHHIDTCEDFNAIWEVCDCQRVFTVQFYVPQLYLRVRISYRLL